MRSVIISLFLVLILSSVALAQSYKYGRHDDDDRRSTRQTYAPSPFETRQESIDRHSMQNYETYRNNGYQAPLGGYSSPLGDPAPRGTLQPGLYPDRSGY